MYKTILCAIDLKRKADKAFEQAVHFAHQYKSKIVLLNVNDNFQTKEDMIIWDMIISNGGAGRY